MKPAILANPAGMGTPDARMAPVSSGIRPNRLALGRLALVFGRHGNCLIIESQ